MNEEYTPFEEWFETFDRDGGELMLYNTIDLEAAYLAGAAAGYTEGAAAGYTKGVTTMREKCAEVAEEYRDNRLAEPERQSTTTIRTDDTDTAGNATSICQSELIESLGTYHEAT